MSMSGSGRDVALDLQNDVWRKVHCVFARRRDEEGLTQAELARRIGLQREPVNYWLSRPVHMTLKAAARLLAGMDVRLECRTRALEEDRPSFEEAA